jgi:NAD+ synthase
VERLAEHLSSWINREVCLSGGIGAAVGLSGGIDSAVVAALAKRAFPHHVLGVLLPCHSDAQDGEDALLIAHHFGVATAMVDLGGVFDLLLEQLGKSSTELADDRTALANIKPRLRMTTLYAFANHLGYRVLGTGNRSEREVGYFTKWGDGAADFLPLGSLNKSQVRALAEYLEVPRRVIDKPPSAGLWSGQTDEDEMGVSYEELDAYLMGAAGDSHPIIDAMHQASQHKRELPKVAPFPEGGAGETTGPRGR